LDLKEDCCALSGLDLFATYTQGGAALALGSHMPAFQALNARSLKTRITRIFTKTHFRFVPIREVRVMPELFFKKKSAARLDCRCALVRNNAR